MKKKRIAVGCIYDENGIIDEYKYYLIDSLHQVADEIVIISNCKLTEPSRSRLEMISNSIYTRDDFGADAGAFKDYFCGTIGGNEWENYDEIVVFNDSCYGPFCEWNKVFSVMDKLDCDYWGIITVTTNGIKTINPYFNVYRINRMRNIFLEFWKQLTVGEQRNKKLIEVYELGMQRYFAKMNVKGASFLNHVCESDFDFRDCYRFEKMILRNGFVNPLLKYKMFSFAINPDYEIKIEELSRIFPYDTDMIYSHINRVGALGKIYPFSEKALEDFVNTHEKIYIFGHGEYGRNLYKYCERHSIRIAGFVVSNTAGEDISIEELVLNKNDGIIVGVGMNLRDEVEEKLLAKFNRKQILLTIRY